MFVDFNRVREESLNRIGSLVPNWLNGKQQGHEFVALNPTRADNKQGSFKINMNTGEWADFATDDKGHDPISLYAYLQGIDYPDAARELAKQFGITSEITPPFERHSKLGIPSQIWRYTDEYYVYRFETKDSGKEFRPVSWDGEKWLWRDPKGKLPLYHLDQLKAQATAQVTICEGEKAADAATRFFPNYVTTTTAHGSKSPQRTDFSPLKERAILIWPDNDAAGKKYAQAVARLALKAGATRVHILQIPAHLPNKWDAANANGEDISGWQWIEVKSQFEKVIDSNWEATLKENQHGTVVNTKVNIRTILTNHADWQGVIGYNQFSKHVNKHKSPPYPHSPNNGLGEWTDADNEMLSMWLGENYEIEPGTDRLQSLIVAISMQNPFHPVREYLEQCHAKWQRAGSPCGYATMWVERYLGAKESPATRLFEKTWLISAVARIYEPGCKADNVLILEGDQGLLKSTALAILGGCWFSDTNIDFADKDSLMLIHESWIIEMPELDKFKKADSDRAKSFFARCEDKYRAPYGHNLITMKRQCVFAGTTNTTDYLKDSTGNRRYMPIECLKRLDIDALKAARDLIWGEAVEMYKKGEKWWYDDTLKHVREAQDARFAEDVWHDVVEEYVSDKKGVTIQMVLTKGLKMEIDRCDKMARNRIADILRTLGWCVDTNLMIDGKRRKGWRRKA